MPDRYVSFPDFALTSTQWDALQIPVGVAFFFMNSTIEPGRRVLPEPGRRDGVAAVARLVGRDRRRQSRIWRPAARRRGVPGAQRRPTIGCATEQPECYLVPIDVCYELVGELRRLWKGFDGGTEAHAALDAFFDRVRDRATTGAASAEGAQR